MVFTPVYKICFDFSFAAVTQFCGNLKEMNAYMNRISLAMFSTFDGGNPLSEFTMPEKFYYGFAFEGKRC